MTTTPQMARAVMVTPTHSAIWRLQRLQEGGDPATQGLSWEVEQKSPLYCFPCRLCAGFCHDVIVFGVGHITVTDATSSFAAACGVSE